MINDRRFDHKSSRTEGLEAFGGVQRNIAQSSLPATLVDLDYLRVSQMNNCAYCIDTHRQDLLRKGHSVEKFGMVQAW